jgi:hypothetical protein
VRLQQILGKGGRAKEGQWRAKLSRTQRKEGVGRQKIYAASQNDDELQYGQIQEAEE